MFTNIIYAIYARAMYLYMISHCRLYSYTTKGFSALAWRENSFRL
nr:MAG TPA: hypothetical protein [Caudoviricetes sp.]